MTLTLTLLVAALGTIALGGLAAWLLRSVLLATLSAVLGGAVTLGVAVWTLRGNLEATALLHWDVPGGQIALGVDSLSAFFLIPLGLVGSLVAIYGRAYLPERPGVAAKLNLLIAAVGMVLIVRTPLVFLAAWEMMTVLAFLLVTSDHEDPGTRRAGWTFLVASHLGLMALLALTLLPEGGTALFLLAIVGFGIKAGLIGAHGWLPEAHAAAPSHVSAFMSAVLVNCGIYGLLRTLAAASPPEWFGVLLAALGLAGALIGVALALTQRDLKRVLAYSTVENMGIVLAGIGFAAWARARGDDALAALAYSGALLHVWNHSLMKSLLFLGAGSVVHATGERSLERLGGLYRRMPWTGAALLLGAVAIAGLPPLNGFVGELLLYQALAGGARKGATAGVALGSMAGVGVLALVGGLALACFVRLIGIGLLGTARSTAAEAAHDPPRGMLAPMVVLAGLCLIAAVTPLLLVDLLAPVVAGFAPVAATSEALGPIAFVNLGLLAALTVVGGWLAWRVRHAPRVETWGCGYGQPTPRMQYTASSFAEMFTWRLLPRWLRPRPTVRPPEGLFPREASREGGDEQDPFTRGAFLPFLVRVGDRFARLRWLQRGSLHLYLLYIVAAAVLGLVWMTVRR